MPVIQSLRRLLMLHDLAFLVLVLVTGALAGVWVLFWQDTSRESIRLNSLSHTAEQIRSDLYRQIKEVIVARLNEDPQALESYGGFTRRIDEQFNELRRRSMARDEDYAVQELQQAYRVLQRDMNNVVEDPYLLNRLTRIRFLDPRYEAELVGSFETAHKNFIGLVEQKLGAVESRVERWSTLTRYLLLLPVAAAVVLLMLSRRGLRRGFVQPIEGVMRGARSIGAGELQHRIEPGGVAEVAQLADTINTMAEELRANSEALVEGEKQAALGSLVPVVAHNVRNPLAAIRASAQLIDHEDSAEELAEVRGSIIDTVDRLGRWINALVSYLHPMKPHISRCTATGLLDAAAALLEPRLADRQLELQRAPWDPEVKVDVDPDLMEQALYGLLSNAVDASQDRGKVVMGVYRDANRIIMSITDSGAGMPFKPAPNNLEPGPSTKRFGTGLGIPVAFKVCRAHGWDLSFGDARGGGTVVSISAPTEA